MIRIEDIRSESASVREWVFYVDNEVDIVRKSLSNGFDINGFNDSILELVPTNFNQDWGLIIFKPIDIPQELEPICLNCRVTSDTWMRLFGHERTKVIGMNIYHWLVRKITNDILNARIRHYPNMSEGNYLLERFFVMEDNLECRKLLRMGTFYSNHFPFSNPV